MSRRGEQYRPEAIVDGRKHPFFIVYKDLLATFGQDLGAEGIAVYCALAYHANNEDNTAWPSVATIMKLTGLARATVRRYIENLERLELVTVYEAFDFRGQTSSIYVLHDIPDQVKPNWREGERPVRESRAFDRAELRSLPSPGTERARARGITESPPSTTKKAAKLKLSTAREGGSEKATWGITLIRRGRHRWLPGASQRATEQELTNQKR